jgi:hypothetical protein
VSCLSGVSEIVGLAYDIIRGEVSKPIGAGSSFYDFSAQKLRAKEMVARVRLPFIFCKGREAFLHGLA